MNEFIADLPPAENNATWRGGIRRSPGKKSSVGTPSASREQETAVIEMPELACEGLHHALGIEGHVVSQSASYGLAYGCPACDTELTSILLCAGRVEFWKQSVLDGAEIECDNCGVVSLATEFWRNVLPLDEPREPSPKPWGARDDETASQPIPATPLSSESSWTEALTEFAAYQLAKGLSERTISNRNYVLRAFAQAVGKDIASVTIHDLREHLGRGISNGSKQSESDTFRAFFRFATGEGYRDDELAEQLPTVRAPRGKPRPYSAEQIDRLLSSGAYGHTRAMILLAVYQGFRAGEVAAVHGRDIDLEANSIRVAGKAGKKATLPMHPVTRELALTMPTDDWWFPARAGREGHIHSRSVSDLMTRAKKRAGITGEQLTGHSLRHSYGTELVRGGVDLRTVQELMRHESLATTQIYTAIDQDQMRDGIERLHSRPITKRNDG